MRKCIPAVAIGLSVCGFVYVQAQTPTVGRRAQVRVGEVRPDGRGVELQMDANSLTQADGTWTASGDVVLNVGGVQVVAERAVLTEAARNALLTPTGQSAEVELEGKVRLILRRR